MEPVRLADVAWKIFEKTGSINAYMLYRELIMLY
ncbi:MAG: YqzL family protein [Clostridiales bacterium]|nr:YqzL family protein [Clostridiales bacterium]